MIRNAIFYYKHSFDGLTKEIWQVSIVSFINRMGSMVLPFLSIYLIKELGWSAGQAGVAAGCFGLGSFFGAILGGRLSDVIGYYKVMIYSLFIGGGLIMALMLYKNFYLMCFALIVTSTFADSFRPAAYTSVSDNSDDETKTRSITLIRMAVNLGIAIGPAIGGFLAASLGYEWIFVMDGLTCIIAGLYLLLKWKKKSWIKVDSKERKWSAVLRDKTFVYFCLINVLLLTCFFQIISTVPVYFKEVIQMSEWEIGLFFTLNGLIIFLTEMPIIHSIEKSKVSLFKFMALGALMITLGTLGLLIQNPFVIGFWVYALLISFGEIISFPFIGSLALEKAGKKNVGSYMGIITVVFSMGHILGPFFGLWMVEHFGYILNWWLMGSLSLLALVGYFLVRSDFEKEIKTLPASNQI